VKAVQSLESILNWDHPLLLNHDLQLTELSGKETMNSGFEFTFTVLSPQPINILTLLYQTTTIQLNTSSPTTRYFSGVVTQIKTSTPLDHYTPYHITLQSWLQLLEHQYHCRIFQNQSVLDILHSITQADSNFSLDKSQLSQSYPPIDYCVQYNESDGHFIKRLLAYHGIHFYFSHQKNRHTLTLLDTLSQNTTEKIPSQWLDYTPPLVWQQHEHSADKYSSNNYDYQKPKQKLQTSIQTKNESMVFNQPIEQYIYPSNHNNTTSIEKELNQISNQHHSQHAIQTRKNTLKLNGVYATDEIPNGIRALSIQHNAHQSSHKHSATKTESYHAQMNGIGADKPYSPIPLSKPEMLNGQIARVTGPKGKTVYVDKDGRIKIRFYWDHSKSSDDNSSCWVRVSEMLAGNRWGSKFTPQVGTEVWVDFIDADPDQPVVIRQAHNPLYPAMYRSNEQAISAIRSPNEEPHLPCNELRFDDSKNRENITLTAQRDLIHQAKHSIQTQVGGDEEHHIEQGNLTLMTHKGHYQLTAKEIHLQSGEHAISLNENALSVCANSIKINCGTTTSPLAALGVAPLGLSGVGYSSATVTAGESGALLAESAAVATEGAELGSLGGPLGALLGLALGGLIGFAIIEVKDHFKSSPRPITPPPKPPKPIKDQPKNSNPPPTEVPHVKDSSPPPLQQANPTTPSVYNNHQYHKPPDSLPAFPEARLARRKSPSKKRGGLRKRWKDKKHIYEWDAQHAKVEKYDKSGRRHLGEFDPNTGQRTKDPDPKRSVEK
jgi:type VI secretion system secreted protein VgrG